MSTILPTERSTAGSAKKNLDYKNNQVVFLRIRWGLSLAGTVVGTLELSIRTKIIIREQRRSAGLKLCVGQVRTDKDTNHMGALEREDVIRT